MSLNESRAISKKTFINFYPLIGTSTGLTEFLTIPNPKHMGSSERYDEIRLWLETLGMIEKTDITYILQTLIPNIENYVTSENTIQTIKDIFILNKKYSKEVKELFKPLSKIKLLTQNGSLKSAKECYLSDFYSPRLGLEEVLEIDIFVSKEYCTDKADKDEWKRFFKLLGVKFHHIVNGISSPSGGFFEGVAEKEPPRRG